MNLFLYRWRDAWMPYQRWEPFPPQAIVQVKNCCGEGRISVAGDLWWDNPDGVITHAGRLDTLKEPPHDHGRAGGQGPFTRAATAVGAFHGTGVRSWSESPNGRNSSSSAVAAGASERALGTRAPAAVPQGANQR